MPDIGRGLAAATDQARHHVPLPSVKCSYLAHEVPPHLTIITSPSAVAVTVDSDAVPFLIVRVGVVHEPAGEVVGRAVLPGPAGSGGVVGS